MKRFVLLNLLVPALLVSGILSASPSAAIQSVEQTADGILAKSEDKVLRVQVFSDEILRVTVAPGETLPEDHSFMVVENNREPVKVEVKDASKKVVLITSKLQASIDKKAGTVRFYDAQGKEILSEISGGRYFKPVQILGSDTLRVQQEFDVSHAKALYGFGGHQNGIVNFKGKDVLLEQYNVIDVNTFMLTDQHFGILWDNDSRTYVGDERDYQPLSTLKLYDAAGKAGGLTATYFNQPDFTDPLIIRTEDQIAYEYIPSKASAPAGFDFKGSIRWEGFLESDVAGVHKFQTYGSSYTRIWVDDVLVVDKWRQNWMPWTNLFEVEMTPGRKVKVVMEWDCNEGYATLKCLTPEPADLDQKLVWTSEAGDCVDYYFVYGATTDEIIANYRKLTGQAPMMPKWAMGMWQCRERYQTQEELLGVVREFRKREMPLDNIVLDWRYWPDPVWGSHEFDPERFPDPKGMVDELHNDLHTRIMISVWPKFNKDIPNYTKFAENGWLYLENIKAGVLDWVGPGYQSTFYDAFNPDARKLFWSLMDESLFSKGIDAWWLDAVEPDMHSNITLDERKARMTPNFEGTGADVFNAYSMVHSGGVYAGQRETAPNQRVFILTRSSYAGQQRYSAATWSGDVAVRWEDLKNQIPAGINFCMSGIPYWTTDIGGFAVESRYEAQPMAPSDQDEFRELMVRWYQFGAFCPLFRVHGQFPYREFYHVAPEGHPVYESMVKYDKLRYHLMPYIYSLTGHVTHEGSTIMRGLMMDFPQDENVLNIADEFMFGPAILVSPVTDYKARNRRVYLPAGSSWYDFHTGVKWQGGQSVVAQAPLTDLPLYVKAGSIVPMGPDLQYTGEKPADPIELRVYTGADGQFVLYEDEGTTYDYEKGAFSEIAFNWNDAKRELRIGARSGAYDGMLQSRTFHIVLVSELNGAGASLSTHYDKTVKYEGDAGVVSF